MKVEELNLSKGNSEKNSRDRHFQLLMRADLEEFIFQEKMFFDQLLADFLEQDSPTPNKTAQAEHSAPVVSVSASTDPLLSENHNLSAAVKAFNALKASFNQVKNPHHRKLLTNLVNAVGPQGLVQVNAQAQAQTQQLYQAAQAKAAQIKASAPPANTGINQQTSANASASQAAQQPQPVPSAPPADVKSDDSSNNTTTTSSDSKAQRTSEPKLGSGHKVKRHQVQQYYTMVNLFTLGMHTLNLRNLNLSDNDKRETIIALKSNSSRLGVLEIYLSPSAKNKHVEEDEGIDLEVLRAAELSLVGNGQTLFKIPENKGAIQEGGYNNDDFYKTIAGFGS